MDQQFEQIYRDLINRKANDHPGYRDLVSLIATTSERTYPSLRADAVYFLANTIYDLVTEPIYLARTQNLALREGTLPSDGEFRNYVESDLSIVVSSSAEVARSRRRDYVSAASAVVGVANVIDTLKINGWRLWGS